MRDRCISVNFLDGEIDRPVQCALRQGHEGRHEITGGLWWDRVGSGFMQPVAAVAGESCAEELWPVVRKLAGITPHSTGQIATVAAEMLAGKCAPITVAELMLRHRGQMWALPAIWRLTEEDK